MDEEACDLEVTAGEDEDEGILGTGQDLLQDCHPPAHKPFYLTTTGNR